jgi:predicted RNA-binding protein YlxR (DUF448 family)
MRRLFPATNLLAGRLTTPDAEADTDAAPDDDEPEKGPLRRCAVTRARLPKETMIRFVIGPDRQVVPDLAARLPGRGIWLSAAGDVIDTARTRGAFAKAARGAVTVPPDLTAVLQASLTRRIGECLGLARRAGQAVCGFQKAREWLVAGRAGLVVEASDGSADERARFLGRHAETIEVIAPLNGAALGAVFGRDHVVHVAIARGRLATALANETKRLAGLSVARCKSEPPALPVGKSEPPARPAGKISKMQAGK